MNEYMELLERPYLKNKDIAKVLGVCPSTVSTNIKKMGLVKYPWGYNTDEIIQKFNLKAYIQRQKKKAPPADQSKSAQKVDM